MPAPMTWKAKALSGHHIGATQVAAVGAFTDQVVFPWASENSLDWGDLFPMNIYYCLVSSIMIYFYLLLLSSESSIIYYEEFYLLSYISIYYYLLLSIILYYDLLLSTIIYYYLLLSSIIWETRIQKVRFLAPHIVKFSCRFFLIQFQELSTVPPKPITSDF